jgi:putative endonuclease
MSYFVYILKCADETLYTGITNNLEKRILAHNNSKQGAKYTASRRPVTLQYSETYTSKSLALKREAKIKKLTRAKKLLLIASLESKTKI